MAEIRAAAETPWPGRRFGSRRYNRNQGSTRAVIFAFCLPKPGSSGFSPFNAFSSHFRNVFKSHPRHFRIAYKRFWSYLKSSSKLLLRRFLSYYQAGRCVPMGFALKIKLTSPCSLNEEFDNRQKEELLCPRWRLLSPEWRKRCTNLSSRKKPRYSTPFSNYMRGRPSPSGYGTDGVGLRRMAPRLPARSLYRVRKPFRRSSPLPMRLRWERHLSTAAWRSRVTSFPSSRLPNTSSIALAPCARSCGKAPPERSSAWANGSITAPSTPRAETTPRSLTTTISRWPSLSPGWARRSPTPAPTFATPRIRSTSPSSRSWS